MSEVSKLIDKINGISQKVSCLTDSIESCCGEGGGGEFYFSVTRAEAESQLADGSLIPGATYKITDRGDRGIYLKATSQSMGNPGFEEEGTRMMLVPTTYDIDEISGNNWKGIWNSSMVPSAGDLTIWGGLVWSNVAGNVGSNSDDFSLDAEWTLVPKASFSNNEYVEMIFSITYDWDNDWISEQRDNKGNVFGLEFKQASFQGLSNNNPVDVSDWNYETTGFLFYNNKAIGILNNIAVNINDNLIYGYSGFIQTNNIPGDIQNNTCHNAIEGNTNQGGIYFNNCTQGIFYNSNNGAIADNQCDGISLNSNIGEIAYNITGNDINSNTNQGVISYNTCTGEIEENSNTGDIKYNSNEGAISGNSNLFEISHNSNKGYISNNSQSGEIYYNSNLGYIGNNSGAGIIWANSNLGYISNNVLSAPIQGNSNLYYISGNSCTGAIQYNSNTFRIRNNTCVTIQFNSNNGEIGSNVHNGDISFNSNNGDIKSCHGAGGFKVDHNINNGNINNPAGLAAADITDVIVNK